MNTTHRPKQTKQEKAVRGSAIFVLLACAASIVSAQLIIPEAPDYSRKAPPIQSPAPLIPDRNDAPERSSFGAEAAWYVILGSFPKNERNRADQYMVSLNGKGLNTSLLDTDRFNGFTPGLWAVAMGPFNKSCAENQLKEAAKTVLDAYIKSASPAVSPSQSCAGAWRGKWNGKNVLDFSLSIRGDDASLEAEGKADTWKWAEIFAGRREGNEISLNGVRFEPPPDDPIWTVDTLSLTLSPDGGQLSGTWRDKDLRQGTLTLFRAVPVATPPPAPTGGSADAEVLFDTAFYAARAAMEEAKKTGSVNGYLETNALKQLANWQAAAALNSSYAQWLLGLCHEKGIGRPKDDAAAFSWYKKSAENGFDVAQNDVGLCYLYGRGVEKNIPEAVTWFTKAAEQGRPSSQYNLGRYYFGEWGEGKNSEKAREWLQKAANQGYGPAEKYLREKLP